MRAGWTRNGLAAAGAVTALAIGASAGAQTPFTVLLMSADSNSMTCAGEDITTDGAYYQSPVGMTNGGPHPAIIRAFPDAEYDSYFAMDIAPSDEDHHAQGSACSGCGYSFVGKSALYIGTAIADPGVGVPSQPKTVNGIETQAMFFARLTREGGAGVQVPEMVFTLEDPELPNRDFVVTVSLGGDPVEGPYGGVYDILEVVSESPLGAVHDLYFVSLPPTGECPADLDGDGVVGSPDLNELLESFAADDGGDVDGDGDTDSDDLNALLAVFGEPCPSGG